MGQQADLDGYHASARYVQETQPPIGSHRELQVVAIRPRIWTGNDLSQGRVSEVSQTTQLPAEDVPLEGKLCLIVYVLPLATAAVIEVGTGWLDAMGGGFQHFQQTAPRPTPVTLHYLYAYPLTRDTAGYEDDPALMSAQRLATMGHAGQLQLQNGSHVPLPGGYAMTITRWVLLV